MADAHASPMLPLQWSDSFAERTGRPAEPRTAPGPQSGFADPPLRPDSTSAAMRPDVIVRTSTRRRKTATAYWENGRILVVMPSHVPPADRAQLIDWLVARVLHKRPGAAATDEALASRASVLADRYVDGVRPASIRWVTNQERRWGSCSTHTGEIRLSHRLRAVPDWVLDATIVHELAHLLHADHSAEFHAVANRHPRQRDARLFLEGYSLGLQTQPDP